MNRSVARILSWFAFISLAGCATAVQITHTARSTVEQRLLVRSLERALGSFNTGELQGKTVVIDFYGLTADKDFAKEFFTAWLQAQQVRVASDAQKAQLHLKVFAHVLGVDQGGAFVGIPALTAPVLGFTVPELSLYKSVTHQGRADVQIYTLDEGSGQFVSKTSVGNGEASYNEYTILILIHFVRTDLDEK